jgi:hypothetical protein
MAKAAVIRQPLYVLLEGLLPSLQHNGRLANPLNFWCKEMKKYSSKRKKTDEDHEKIMEIEYKGGMYLRNDQSDLRDIFHDEASPLVWPGDNTHAMIKEGAKLDKNGKLIDSGLFCLEDARLIYDGPQTRGDLWDAGDEFRLVKKTKRGVMSCRTMIPEWKCEFNLYFSPNAINYEDIVKALEKAGEYIGFTDWPRRYGLFKVLKIEKKHHDIWTKAKRRRA